MHAHTPPYTKPESVHDSARLYRETSEIAAAQDAKLDKPADPVNAPSHYALGDREAIDVIESVAATVIDPVDAVLTSHALKYLMRWPRKGGITDLLKCRWYLARLIARVGDRAERKSALAELARLDQTMGLYDSPTTRDFVIGDVPHVRHSTTSTATSQHPVAAEAERIATQADGCRNSTEDVHGYFRFKFDVSPGDHL